ncbi:TP53 regulating kinase [Nematocida homosporus]|uniref:TP53 regulating kinase n=1 Tax=Nematocida homosporus TaxID=1912981 RepID=UPI00221FD583|nr:TP53 regulating kinase [Nematocida homosporus]KAI5184397.1 TP53 regulating kinase [Nematocida homosporus]
MTSDCMAWVVIGRGAEAIVGRCLGWIVKTRIKKGYRLAAIDERLRRERTRREKNVLGRLEKTGVTPKLADESKAAEIATAAGVDLNDSVVMKEALGLSLYELASSISTTELTELVVAAAEAVGRVHSLGIVHGDITLNNIIAERVDGQPVRITLIDFGLSSFTGKDEDRAVDLYLFERAVRSATGEDLSLAIEQGYAKSGSAQTLKRLESVRQRGRKRELSAVG